MLSIYNSKSKQKEIFKPLRANEVTLYVCGMTVYDYCHIGHARMMVAFDVINRYLRYCGYKVKYVRNITDIDDKIIRRALENKEPMEVLTTRFINALIKDMRALGTLPPDLEPKATDYVPQMISLIETLLHKGFAYVGSTGDVYFDVMQFKNYGKLAHKDLEALEAGARIAIEEAKKTPLDFVLWKLSKENEPYWPSPWGNGRPGWHTECVVMSSLELGQPFDIHGGGNDLKFPHHENEIAQAECAYGKPFVNYWMHVGFVEINKEKMSKSLNNFFTIREVLREWKNEVVRYFLLSGHYRSPVDYSLEALEGAQNALDRLYGALRGIDLTTGTIENEVAKAHEVRFMVAMDDDFNTPIALSVLFDLARELNRSKVEEPSNVTALAQMLKKLAAVLGLLVSPVESYFQKDAHSVIDANEIEALIALRQSARLEKNWAKADEIRQQLAQKGVVIEDSGDGTTWRYQ
ncbi:MAG: cysS [Gammaproteobacteria bacterium]|jgi:cysteinyl-tRNA synthetase|nr:cysS [Gammaproteobacteria bacterium]